MPKKALRTTPFGIGDGKTGGFMKLKKDDITEIYRIAANSSL